MNDLLTAITAAEMIRSTSTAPAPHGSRRARTSIRARIATLARTASPRRIPAPAPAAG